MTTTSIPSSRASRTSSTEVTPAVHRQQQPGPPLGQPPHVLVREPVAVLDPVGNEPVALGAKPPQRRDHQRRRADSVDVEVAVDGDPTTRLDRGSNPARPRRPCPRTPPADASRPPPGMPAPAPASGIPAAPASPQPARSRPARRRARAPRHRSRARRRMGWRFRTRFQARKRGGGTSPGREPEGAGNAQAELSRGALPSACRSRRRPPARSAVPGIAISAVERSVSPRLLPLTSWTIIPKTIEPSTAPRKAPTIPCQNRSGRKTVKCQRAIPMMKKTTRAISEHLPCLRRAWRRARRSALRWRRSAEADAAASVSPLSRELAPLPEPSLALDRRHRAGGSLGGRRLDLRRGFALRARRRGPVSPSRSRRRRRAPGRPRLRRSAGGGGRSPAHVPSRRSAPARR